MATSAHDVAKLSNLEVIVTYSGGGVRHVRTAHPVVTVGRLLDNDIVLPGVAVSRHHARIEANSGGWAITDLGSTHGTAVNGVAIAPNRSHPIVRDATISIGGFALTLWQPSNEDTGSLNIAHHGGPRQAPIAVDQARRQVSILGNPIEPPLSRSEFELVAALAAAPGKVCTYDELGTAVWGSHYREADRFYRYGLYGLVHSIRDRIAQAGGARGWVAAARGVGYRLTSEAIDD